MKLQLAALRVAATALASLPAAAQSQLWITQFGTTENEQVFAAAPDGALGVFLGGRTRGSLGAPHQGSSLSEDAWVARYDSAGSPSWIWQAGTSAHETVWALASDAAGGVFAGGTTTGSFGGPYQGGSGNDEFTAGDAWLARCDSTGSQLWIRQLGSPAKDMLSAAAPDGAGGVYVGGRTLGDLGGPKQSSPGGFDAWLARYDASGVQLWTRQFIVTGSTTITAAAPDGVGGVYVGGVTVDTSTGWLARYDSAGTAVWTRIVGGSGNPCLSGAATDGQGGVFVVGATWDSFGGPNAGTDDAWLARYGAAGNRIWIRQFGTSSTDGLSAAATDGRGGVFVGGSSASNPMVARYDAGGTQTWIQQPGSGSSASSARAAAPDGSGGVYFAGDTPGSLGGPSFGGRDAWLVRYDVPPVVKYCTSGITSLFCTPVISSSGTPSASAPSGFTIAVNSAEGQRSGLLFYGIDNSAFAISPWSPQSTSYMCVRPPRERTPAQSTGGTLGGCDGSLSLDWNAFRASNPGALGQPFPIGQHVYAQAWFRDPPAPNGGTLSDALEVVLQP